MCEDNLLYGVRLVENEEWRWGEKEAAEPKSREGGPEGRRHTALDVNEIDLMNNSCGRH